ncbi:MarR family winged helix-turn-helix transcriptional regulator [Desulforudis sp. 1088]|uniref:MarR family winged helix-turn-helix transcriptional regulator n=1 Tax=unclassified Candidatus Desulforudis TaxID=2635950 RepID=UPI00348E6B09
MKNERLDECLQKIDEVMGQLMRHMHFKLGKHVPEGITMSQFMVCKRVGVHGRVKVSTLADDLGVSLSAITAAADRLVEMRLLGRQRDEQDRRLVWLTLTPEGEEMLQNAQQQWLQTMRGYFGALPIEDLEKLVAICERLLEVVNAKETSTSES